MQFQMIASCHHHGQCVEFFVLLPSTMSLNFHHHADKIAKDLPTIQSTLKELVLGEITSD
jgi:hypothetical protein